MKLTDRQRVEWIVAIVIATHHGATTLPLSTLFKSAVAVWRAFMAKPESEVSEEMFQARMAVCRECPVYNPKRKTCGFVEHDGKVLGCGCYLPVLARLKATHCWIRENTQLEGVGWPDELMP